MMVARLALSAIIWFPWALLALGTPLAAWWLFEPVPVELRYVAPQFVSQPAETREEAEANAITQTVGGVTVWRYVEFCVRRPFSGTSHRVWVNEALVWHAPDLPTVLSRTPGCRATSIPVAVPTSSPTREFQFVQWLELQTNPLRTDKIEYAPIPLRILDSALRNNGQH